MWKYCNIFKNLKLVKLVFAVITAYLLVDEILVFLSMPTFTSETRTSLGAEHFPQIRLCPFPAFNQMELERQGYRTSYEFTLGTLRTVGNRTGVKGWFGNQSDWEISVASLTGLQDCPSVSLKFKTDRAITWQQPDMAVTRPINPFGKCCKAEIVIIDRLNSSLDFSVFKE